MIASLGMVSLRLGEGRNALGVARKGRCHRATRAFGFCPKRLVVGTEHCCRLSLPPWQTMVVSRLHGLGKPSHICLTTHGAMSWRPKAMHNKDRKVNFAPPWGVCGENAITLSCSAAFREICSTDTLCRCSRYSVHERFRTCGNAARGISDTNWLLLSMHDGLIGSTLRTGGDQTLPCRTELACGMDQRRQAA